MWRASGVYEPKNEHTVWDRQISEILLEIQHPKITDQNKEILWKNMRLNNEHPLNTAEDKDWSEKYKAQKSKQPHNRTED